MSRCTVIIRTRNSEPTIGRVMAGLYSQDFKAFDVLVVDSGSRDRTLEIVARHPHRLIRIRPEEYIPGAVLNRAATATDAPVLAFLNSDTIPLHASVLSRLVAAIDAGADAAFARQVARPEARAWVRREYAASFPDAPEAPPWIPLSLPFAAMRREAWEAHPFHTGAWGSEDTEWGHWARTHGRTVRYVPDAVVVHSHDYTPRQFYGRRFIEGEADAFIYGTRPSLPRSAVSAAVRTVRDVAGALAAGDVRDAVEAPLRRIAEAAGYWRGLRLGQRRRATGDPDVSAGQRVVLERHEAR
ncbi:MAG: glycosyltransferase family 2 protein [Deltaproteobacteria bacterium]|nr:glycosyltransferase family 2 protein [Deltaproteobacteria bacterium]